MDQVGNWEAWPSGDGDTYTRIDPSAIPPTPWWNSAYGWKRNLIILNNDSDTIPASFPIHIHFDSSTSPTAAEIFNASQSATKGDDVRITYDNQTELNRFIQHFTSSQIDIWFPLQASLGGGNTNSGVYQVYYGNPSAATPPASVNTVFLPGNDANTMGLWHFQEANGSTVSDSSGRSHHGTFYDAGWSDGLLGWAGSFNGSSSYVEIGHSEDFRPGAITLEAWIYLNGSTSDYPMIFNKDRYWLRVTGDRQLQLIIKAEGGDRTVTGSTNLNLNQWYHVAATYDGGTIMKVYLNGVQDGQITNGAPLVLWNTHPLRIGRSDYNNTGYFPGFIQHARISNIARTNFSYGRIDSLPSVAVGTLIEPPVAGSADLDLLSLNTFPSSSAGVLVQAILQNKGNLGTQNGFITDLYMDHVPAGVGDYTGSVQFWVNDPVGAGSTITLTSELSDFPGLLGFSSQSLQAGSEITTTLYAQVDSTGSVTESDDQNNISTSGTQVCLASPDAYESDDTIGSATVLNQGQFQKHNFDNTGDEDWISFSAQKNEGLIIKTFELSPSSDTYLYLYDSDGTTLLASNDDYGGSLASQIEWRAPASGTYYVLVKHWNPNVGGCGTSYTVSITEKVYGEFRIYLPLTIQK
jgi:hypothetical protein